MLVSIGRLEPVASISSVSYDDATGAIDITWNSACYGNGGPDDTVHIVIYKKPEDGDLFYQPYGWLSVPTITGITRADATFSFSIAPGLTDTDLTVYLFFHNSGIGYSPSKAMQIGA